MKTTYLIAIVLLFSSCNLFWTPLENELFSEDHFIALTENASFFNDNAFMANIVDIDSNLVKDQSILFTNFEEMLNNGEEVWVFKDDVIRVLDQGNLDLIESINKPVARTSANYILDDLIYSILQDTLYTYSIRGGAVQDEIMLRNNTQNHQFFGNSLYYNTDSSVYQLNLNTLEIDSLVFDSDIIEITAEEFRIGVLTGSRFDFKLYQGFQLDNLVEMQIDDTIEMDLSLINKSLGFIKNRIVLLSNGEIYITESSNEIVENDKLNFERSWNFGLNHFNNFVYAFNRETIEYYDIDRNMYGELDHDLNNFRMFFVID